MDFEDIPQANDETNVEDFQPEQDLYQEEDAGDLQPKTYDAFPEPEPSKSYDSFPEPEADDALAYVSFIFILILKVLFSKV